MTLAALIRKRDVVKLATAIPAIFATQHKGCAATVARIATIAVANSKEDKTALHAQAVSGGVMMIPFDPLKGKTPLTAEAESAIRAWLAHIEETDAATIAEVIGQCQRDTDAREYFTNRAAAELSNPSTFSDDRITCSQCSSFTYGGVCSVAAPGAVVSANRGYRPDRDILQRCNGYKAKL